MIGQATLELFKAEADDPNVRELERLLQEYRGWMSSSLIGSKTGWNSDKINALARASVNVISGQLGYKHQRHATDEEWQHFYNGLMSRAGELQARAERSRKYRHKVLG